MTTYCRDCDNVHPDTRKHEPWRWRCMKWPVRPGHGYVDPTFSPDPPYAKCETMNRFGRCEVFEPIRVAEKVA